MSLRAKTNSVLFCKTPKNKPHAHIQLNKGAGDKNNHSRFSCTSMPESVWWPSSWVVRLTCFPRLFLRKRTSYGDLIEISRNITHLGKDFQPCIPRSAGLYFTICHRPLFRNFSMVVQLWVRFLIGTYHIKHTSQRFFSSFHFWTHFSVLELSF